LPTDSVAAGVLTSDTIRVGQRASDRDDAIRQCGRLLVEAGAVEEPYAAAMLERELSISTYMGEGVAIPHGTDASRRHVLRTTVAVLQFPDGVDWGGAGTVYVCIAIASSGEEHLPLIAALAQVLLTADRAAELRTAASAERVLALLQPSPEENDE
jgi:mannitol/fructose-specific phosphotransferase system IIA component